MDVHHHEDTDDAVASEGCQIRRSAKAVAENDLPSEVTFGDCVESDHAIAAVTGRSDSMEVSPGPLSDSADIRVSGTGPGQVSRRVSDDSTTAAAGSTTVPCPGNGDDQESQHAATTPLTTANTKENHPQYLRPSVGLRQESTWSNSTVKAVTVKKCDSS